MRKLVKFIVKLCKSFYLNNGLYRVGDLSYTLLLSFIPFSICVASLIGALPISKNMLHYVEKFIFANLLPATGEAVYRQFNIFLLHSKQLSLIGFGFLVITAVNMLHSLTKHINEMWQIKYRRKLYLVLITYAGVLILGPILLSSGIFLRLYIKSYLHVSNWAVNTTILNILTTILSIMVFSTLYKVLPFVKVHIKYAVIAGTIAGIAFELAKMGFIIYARYFANYNLLYGSLAVIPLFLLWIYISSFILLFCAQIAYILEILAKGDSEQGLDAES